MGGPHESGSGEFIPREEPSLVIARSVKLVADLATAPDACGPTHRGPAGRPWCADYRLHMRGGQGNLLRTCRVSPESSDRS